MSMSAEERAVWGEQVRREQSRPLRALTDDEIAALLALQRLSGVLRSDLARALDALAALASFEDIVRDTSDAASRAEGGPDAG